MHLAEFDYPLPKSQIAQYPLPRRDGSRLLILHRKGGSLAHRTFRDLPDFLQRGDTLVLNDTKVQRARLLGRKESGGRAEAVLLGKTGPGEYEALLRTSGRLRTGARLFFGRRRATLVGGNGVVKRIRFQENGGGTWLKREGTVALPPYIQRPPESGDLSRYQTVYARREGAIAAPTAGLHFTRPLFRALSRRGVRRVPVTLHVGYGTFEPVREESVSAHRMHAEYFEISPRSAAALNRARREGGRIVAVGTTSCRVLETSVQGSGFRVQKRFSTPCTLHPIPSFREMFRPMKGWTDLFIYPPYRFRGTDALLTNFHLPKSTLFMLACAFAGKTLVQRAYREAVQRKYRFYSYGDAMLIL